MNPVEESIKAAIERGEFDNLPGAGKPLHLADDGPGWWVRKFIERTKAEDAQIEFERWLMGALDEAWLLPDEAAVRDWVEEINRQIEGKQIEGKQIERIGIEALDEGEVLTGWRRMARARRR